MVVILQFLIVFIHLVFDQYLTEILINKFDYFDFQHLVFVPALKMQTISDHFLLKPESLFDQQLLQSIAAHLLLLIQCIGSQDRGTLREV